MKKTVILALYCLFAFSLKAQVEYLYDFNNLIEGSQNLNGQDGWMTHYQTAGSSQDFDVSYVCGSDIAPDESLAIWYPYGGSGVGRTATRKASPNFNFSFQEGGIMDLEIDMNRTWWGSFFGVGFDGNGDGHILPGMTDPDGGVYLFIKSQGDSGHAKVCLPDGSNIEFDYEQSGWTRYKMSFDFSAYDGAGAVTVFVKPGCEGEWIQMAGCTNACMNLTPGSGDKLDYHVWDGLFFHSQGGTGGFDNLLVRQQPDGNAQLIEMADIPEAVQNHKIAYVAAGIDHAIAIDEEGHVYGWGATKRGQYTYYTPDQEVADDVVSIPEGLANGTETVDVANIKKVACGYQITAILMNDGSLYIWGNAKSYSNMDKFVGKTDLIDIDFTLNNIVGVTTAQNGVYTGKRGLFDKLKSTLTGKAVASREFLNGRKVVRIAATSKNVCGELDDGSIFFVGDAIGSNDPVPALHAGEKFIELEAGTYHYVGLTSEGRVLCWGGNTLSQTDVPSDLAGTTKLYCGAFQTYAVNDQNELVDKWGNKGYLFGTDKYGADIFQRIIKGGKMTMTIGAIAVIISSIIGVIVGVVSGYFGGKVDMILMRITEIFAAIPFLPFALILSALMSQMNISENSKIFLLMVILGVLTWTGLARIVRAQVLAARENEYVTAAKAMGVRERNIAFKHILPNIVSIILVSLTLDFATCMLTESSLSYLGFGVTYPRPTWGNMLNGVNNATIIKNFWWQWVFTSIFLAVTCICINIIGDTLRDVIDPKSDRDK